MCPFVSVVFCKTRLQQTDFCHSASPNSVSCQREQSGYFKHLFTRVYVRPAQQLGVYGGPRAPVTHEMFFIAVSHSWLLPGRQMGASENPLVPVFSWWALPSWGVLKACQVSASVPTFNLADLCKIPQTSGSYCSPSKEKKKVQSSILRQLFCWRAAQTLHLQS